MSSTLILLHRLWLDTLLWPPIRHDVCTHYT
uniref:Uncharacterized protein n=1 Tax=Arundo donax TaxID=35708 RepID=A0A0A8Z404_ARUDO